MIVQIYQKYYLLFLLLLFSMPPHTLTGLCEVTPKSIDITKKPVSVGKNQEIEMTKKKRPIKFVRTGKLMNVFYWVLQKENRFEFYTQ